jgi:hypothetical protein
MFLARRRRRDWIHEIKLGGLRLLAFRAGKRVRLYTPQGDDWGDRFPLITVAVAALQLHSCLIDGEAVICGEKRCRWFSSPGLLALQPDGIPLRLRPASARWKGFAVRAWVKPP